MRRQTYGYHLAARHHCPLTGTKLHCLVADTRVQTTCPRLLPKSGKARTQIRDLMNRESNALTTSPPCHTRRTRTVLTPILNSNRLTLNPASNRGGADFHDGSFRGQAPGADVRSRPCGVSGRPPVNGGDCMRASLNGERSTSAPARRHIHHTYYYTWRPTGCLPRPRYTRTLAPLATPPATRPRRETHSGTLLTFQKLTSPRSRSHRPL